MGFTTCRARQPQRGMELQEKKEEKDEKDIYEPIEERCILNLDLKSFRSKVKGKHSAEKEFQSLAVRVKKILPKTFLYYLEMMTEMSCNLLE